ncbi:MAG: DUF5947 family protein [Candidatus Velthaea sp.]
MEREPSGFNALKQLLGKRAMAPPGERCDFCAVPVFPEHGHLIDVTARRILCACRPCALTMEPSGAAHGRYKQIPTRYLALDAFSLTDADWDALQIPIGLAFMFKNSVEARMTAFYPGPAGATESQLSLETWQSIASNVPVFSTLEPDTEAILIRRPMMRRNARRDEPFQGSESRTRCYIVPIDTAYELVGLMRTGWRGFDGGDDVWKRIDGYFEGLDRRTAHTTALPG